eukprot:1840950-Alexandrium_andersonii.AAC.1
MALPSLSLASTAKASGRSRAWASGGRPSAIQGWRPRPRARTRSDRQPAEHKVAATSSSVHEARQPRMFHV